MKKKWIAVAGGLILAVSAATGALATDNDHEHGHGHLSDAYRLVSSSVVVKPTPNTVANPPLTPIVVKCHGDELAILAGYRIDPKNEKLSHVFYTKVTDVQPAVNGEPIEPGDCQQVPDSIVAHAFSRAIQPATVTVYAHCVERQD